MSSLSESSVKTTCSLDSCSKPGGTKGLCPMHYTRRLRRGTFDLLSTEERFWRLVKKNADVQGCWEWQGSKSVQGYGVFKRNGKRTPAHRFSLEVHLGRPVVGWAIHSCDNPPCVNPAHLREGTPKDNSRDRTVRGRTPGVKGRINTVLTDDAVREIRRSSESNRILAARFAVTIRNIRLVRHRKTWRHIE